MDELEDEFNRAKSVYQDLINEDFPDFNFDEYGRENSPVPDDPNIINENNANGKTRLGKKVLDVFDVSGDGKLDASDFVQMPGAVAKNTASAAQSIGKFMGNKAASFDIGKAVSGAKATVSNVGRSIASTEVSEVAGTAVKIGKTAVGVQGLQNRSAAKRIQEVCNNYYDAAEAVTEHKRQELNYAITSFGEYRLRALHQTVGRFLQYLKELEQNNAAKEYEILFGAEIDIKTLDKLEHIDMAASEALRSTAISGTFGAVAVLGTPAIVTGAVGALATASTGTAISGLSGAAANSAILAWLGGGSLAAGGGGMAAGAVTLAAVTAGATAVATILAAGTIVSMHYGKKLTEAKEYEKQVGVTVANLEKAWAVMGGISERTSELREVTEELKWRTIELLNKLEPIIPNFDFADPECIKLFNKCALLIKTMVELAQTPLLDDDGNLSTESMRVSSKVRKVLNTEV